MAPFNTEIPWSTKALQGAYRFVKRVWEIYQKQSQNSNVKSQIHNSNLKSDKNLEIKLYKTIKKVTSDIPEVKFNTSIAAMMEFLNDWEKALGVRGYGLSVENAKKFLQVLAPFAPFLTEEIWHTVFGEKSSIHLSSWPKVTDEIVEEEIILPVQVNGKLRGTVIINQSESSKSVEAKALKDEKIKKHIIGKPKKIIYVPRKIINIIV